MKGRRSGGGAAAGGMQERPPVAVVLGTTVDPLQPACPSPETESDRMATRTKERAPPSLEAHCLDGRPHHADPQAGMPHAAPSPSPPETRSMTLLDMPAASPSTTWETEEAEGTHAKADFAYMQNILQRENEANEEAASGGESATASSASASASSTRSGSRRPWSPAAKETQTTPPQDNDVPSLSFSSSSSSSSSLTTSSSVPEARRVHLEERRGSGGETRHEEAEDHTPTPTQKEEEEEAPRAEWAMPPLTSISSVSSSSSSTSFSERGAESSAPSHAKGHAYEIHQEDENESGKEVALDAIPLAWVEELAGLHATDNETEQWFEKKRRAAIRQLNKILLHEESKARRKLEKEERAQRRAERKAQKKADEKKKKKHHHTKNEPKTKEEEEENEEEEEEEAAAAPHASSSPSTSPPNRPLEGGALLPPLPLPSASAYLCWTSTSDTVAPTVVLPTTAAHDGAPNHFLIGEEEVEAEGPPPLHGSPPRKPSLRLPLPPPPRRERVAALLHPTPLDDRDEDDDSETNPNTDVRVQLLYPGEYYYFHPLHRRLTRIEDPMEAVASGRLPLSDDGLSLKYPLFYVPRSSEEDREMLHKEEEGEGEDKDDMEWNALLQSVGIDPSGRINNRTSSAGGQDVRGGLPPLSPLRREKAVEAAPRPAARIEKKEEEKGGEDGALCCLPPQSTTPQNGKAEAEEREREREVPWEASEGVVGHHHHEEEKDRCRGPLQTPTSSPLLPTTTSMEGVVVGATPPHVCPTWPPASAASLSTRHPPTTTTTSSRPLTTAAVPPSSTDRTSSGRISGRVQRRPRKSARSAGRPHSSSSSSSPSFLSPAPSPRGGGGGVIVIGGDTGCPRLNPYCAVCRQRFHLVLVDRHLRPIPLLHASHQEKEEEDGVPHSTQRGEKKKQHSHHHSSMGREKDVLSPPPHSGEGKKKKKKGSQRKITEDGDRGHAQGTHRLYRDGRLLTLVPPPSHEGVSSSSFSASGAKSPACLPPPSRSSPPIPSSTRRSAIRLQGSFRSLSPSCTPPPSTMPPSCFRCRGPPPPHAPPAATTVGKKGKGGNTRTTTTTKKPKLLVKTQIPLVSKAICGRPASASSAAAVPSGTKTYARSTYATMVREGRAHVGPPPVRGRRYPPPTTTSSSSSSPVHPNGTHGPEHHAAFMVSVASPPPPSSSHGPSASSSVSPSSFGSCVTVQCRHVGPFVLAEAHPALLAAAAVPARCGQEMPAPHRPRRRHVAEEKGADGRQRQLFSASASSSFLTSLAPRPPLPPTTLLQLQRVPLPYPDRLQCQQNEEKKRKNRSTREAAAHLRVVLPSHEKEEGSWVEGPSSAPSAASSSAIALLPPSPPPPLSSAHDTHKEKSKKTAVVDKDDEPHPHHHPHHDDEEEAKKDAEPFISRSEMRFKRRQMMTLMTSLQHTLEEMSSHVLYLKEKQMRKPPDDAHEEKRRRRRKTENVENAAEEEEEGNPKRRRGSSSITPRFSDPHERPVPSLSDGGDDTAAAVHHVHSSRRKEKRREKAGDTPALHPHHPHPSPSSSLLPPHLPPHPYHVPGEVPNAPSSTAPPPLFSPAPPPLPVTLPASLKEEEEKPALKKKKRRPPHRKTHTKGKEEERTMGKEKPVDAYPSPLLPYPVAAFPHVYFSPHQPPLPPPSSSYLVPSPHYYNEVLPPSLTSRETWNGMVGPPAWPKHHGVRGGRPRGVAWGGGDGGARPYPYLQRPPVVSLEGGFMPLSI